MSYSSRLRERARFVRSLLTRLPPEARTELLQIADVLDREQRSDAEWAWLARWVPDAPDDPVRCLPLWQWVDRAATALAENKKTSNRALTALVGVAKAARGEKRERAALRRSGKPARGRPEKTVDPHLLRVAKADYLRLVATLQEAQSKSLSDAVYRIEVRKIVEGELPPDPQEKPVPRIARLSVKPTPAEAREKLITHVGMLSVKPSVAAAKISKLKHGIAARRLLQGRTAQARSRRRAPEHLVFSGADAERHEHAAEAHRSRGKVRRPGHGPDA